MEHKTVNILAIHYAIAMRGGVSPSKGPPHAAAEGGQPSQGPVLLWNLCCTAWDLPKLSSRWCRSSGDVLPCLQQPAAWVLAPHHRAVVPETCSKSWPTSQLMTRPREAVLQGFGRLFTAYRAVAARQPEPAKALESLKLYSTVQASTRTAYS